MKKMPIEDIHLALAPNPRVLLGSCAPSSAVSVAGGWWVAAEGHLNLRNLLGSASRTSSLTH